MRRRSASLTIVLCSLAAAPGAGAQAPSPAVYGGGAIAAAYSSSPRTYDAGVAVGLRRDGAHLSVRVAVSRSCARYREGGWRAADVVTGATVAADGTFHLAAKPVKTEELGTVRLTLDGTLAAGRADGTLRVDTAYPCDGAPVAWTARSVDPNAALPPAAPAPADGLLYGATTQDVGDVPHGLVVRVTGGGTAAYAFGSYTTRCEGRDGDGPYLTPIDNQVLFARTRIAAGRWTRRDREHQSAAEARHGDRWTRRSGFDATFAGTALAGTLLDTGTYAYRSAHDQGRCAIGAVRFVAVP